jgi:hypothetical protein
MFLISALISTNPRRRNELIQFFQRQRIRSLRKARHVISLIISLYYTWKGGGLRVKNSAGNEVEITDPTLTDSQRIRALAEQSKINSNDLRMMELLRQILDLIFFWLEDDSDLELMRADLWRTMDYADAPSADQFQAMNANYNQRFGSAPMNSLQNASAVDRNAQLGSPNNPIPVDSRRGGL